MHFIDFKNPGSPDVLFLNEKAIPEPGANEVLVEVKAGDYPPPPGASPILGLEVAGVIRKIGDGAKKWNVGDAICGLTNGGGYAEYCTIPEGQCLPLPYGLNFIEAASLPETYFTVWGNLFMRTHLKSGESILIHGGSSGIGSCAIQLAKAHGAHVITTVGSMAKVDFCKKLRADQIINYKKEDFFSLLKEKGVNIVLDIIGKDYFEKNLFLLKEEGRLVQIACMHGSSATIDLDRLHFKRLTILGSTLRAQSTEAKARIAQELLINVWPLFEKKLLKPVVTAIFPLSKAFKAHKLMESSQHCGKIVLNLQQ